MLQIKGYVGPGVKTLLFLSQLEGKQVFKKVM